MRPLPLDRFSGTTSVPQRAVFNAAIGSLVFGQAPGSKWEAGRLVTVHAGTTASAGSKQTASFKNRIMKLAPRQRRANVARLFMTAMGRRRGTPAYA